MSKQELLRKWRLETAKFGEMPLKPLLTEWTKKEASVLYETIAVSEMVWRLRGKR